MMSRSLDLLLLAFLGLFAFITPAAAGPDFWTMWQHRNTCMQKDAQVLAAIMKFCSRNFYTGTPYAVDGASQGKVRINVSAYCKLGTFVPKEWCESQMLETCATGGKKGRNFRKYDNGCQGFWIGGS